ncbi:hypothetical protein M9H77_36576 [Catharanthus roseus]|uniref:Uncharacterized protein n=1 Tax=Catharanthus roseus TaxID=4058 RepID=A0ACB9ZS62_CATRO|nr:hypothetical protein M9H77_36576 [Catharanthus roseus]
MDARKAERDKIHVPSISYLSMAKQESPCLPSASLRILKEHESKLRSLQRDKASSLTTSSSSRTCDSNQLLSTDGIMKMARARLHQSNYPLAQLIPVIRDDEFVDTRLGVPPERSEDFELALIFQFSVLKYSMGQLIRAGQLLGFCKYAAPANGSPVQRVVHYFAESLQERIGREMGMIPSEAAAHQNVMKHGHTDEILTNPQSAIIQCQQEIPFCHVSQFTAIETIMEHVESAKIIHLIDLGIRNGSHWPIMMQAVADRQEYPLELLKISAVGQSKEIIEEMGEILSSFAKTMNVPFTFKLVLSNIEDLKEEMFEIEPGEAVVVYSDTCLASLLPRPDRLESVILAMKNLKPCLMVICELEASTCSPTVMGRFNNALSLFCALFDCFEDCFDRDNPFRAMVEEHFFRKGIHNSMAAEDDKRVYCHEKIDFWRSFFARLGIIEIPMSDSALYQAKFLCQSNARWSSCTLDINGKSLILGWKGTPIKFLSAWKFS